MPKENFAPKNINGQMNATQRVTGGAAVLTVTANAITPNSDLIQQGSCSNGAGLSINNPTGTPKDGQVLRLRIKNTSGSPITITLAGSQFRFGTVITALSALAAGKKALLGFVWDSEDSKWDFVSESTGH